MKGQYSWWQDGVIYQIYPRSFADASGDGVGDLRGIAGRLDYLEWLGVDAVWLSPFYTSPMADFGYDISDYCGVDPLFGTLEDFDELLEKARRRGIRTVVDLVPNHTSDEHPWFAESRSSRDNPKRDWYVWHDPKPDGSPPNNWESVHGGGSCWEWDEKTRQYYLHTFQVEQPDLNWRNPRVREAMYDVMRFWLDRGVDGFRLDALSFCVKDDRLRDNPPNPGWKPGDPPWTRQIRLHSDDQPEMMEVVREMRAVADEYGGGRVLIGELYLPLERLIAYYGTDLDGVHLPFNFGLVDLAKWEPRAVGRLISAYETALPEGAWPNWVLGNHDQSRVATRLGEERARLAQMLLLTLRGTPTCYYGDEIGMQDVPVHQDLVQDPQGKLSPGHSRDPERSPMQWDASPNAGFCPPEVDPWLPITGDYKEVNVEAQKEASRSMLSLFRRLVGLRREHPALVSGSYESLDPGDENVLAYQRSDGDSRALVVLNFGPQSVRPRLPKRLAASGAKLLCSTDPERKSLVDADDLELGPYEGVLLSI